MAKQLNLEGKSKKYIYENINEIRWLKYFIVYIAVSLNPGKIIF